MDLITFAKITVVVAVVVTIGWIALWLLPRWVRWSVLAVADIASACCLAYSFLIPRMPVTPQNCSWAPGCLSSTPVWWAFGGLAGVLLVNLLALGGLLAEGVLLVIRVRRASAQGRHERVADRYASSPGNPGI